LLAPGQKQFVAFSGVDSSAISNSVTLFGDKFSKQYTQPLKFISGAKYRMGVTDKLTVGFNVAHDSMLRNPSRLLMNNSKSFSSARFTRTGRSSSGSIFTMDMDYVASKNLRLQSEVGYSMAHSKLDSYFDPDGNDVGGFLGFNYNRKGYALSGKAFSYGPNFYSAGSAGFMDRRGFELNSNWNIGSVAFNGGITRYNSNLDDFFDGGRSTILDYNLYASGKIDEYSTMRAGIRSTGAGNDIYEERDTTIDLTINRKLHSKVDLTVNYARTMRKSRTITSTETQKTSNNRINADLNIDAGKLGVVRLSHEMMMLDPVDRLLMGQIDQSFPIDTIYSKNIRLTLDRSSKPIKGITMSPNVGYRYGGDSKGLNFGLNMGYLFKSGKQVMLSYAYNSTFGRYMARAISFGGNKSHSLSFNFTDTLGFGANRRSKTNNGFQSTFDPNTGIIKGCVYVDTNQNGIKDSTEQGIPDIEVNFQNLYSVTTDKDGNFIAANIPQGYRKLGINKDTLPVIYTPSIADALVNVKAQKVYNASLGVLVTPGSITGKVEVNKDGLTNQEVVISLIDKDGKEIKYTTTDSAGGFYIGSVPPGDYTVIVDKNYLDYKGLQDDSPELHKVTIPLVTDDFVDLNGVDFKLGPKRGEVKKF
jgi:hypothetical protein